MKVRLVFKGKLLKDHKLVSNYHFTPDCFLHANLALPRLKDRDFFMFGKHQKHYEGLDKLHSLVN